MYRPETRASWAHSNSLRTRGLFMGSTFNFDQKSKCSVHINPSSTDEGPPRIMHSGTKKQEVSKRQRNGVIYDLKQLTLCTMPKREEKNPRVVVFVDCFGSCRSIVRNSF